MKRIFALAALLTAASACAPAEQGKASNANTRPAANAATPQASPASADFAALDREIWEAIKAKNWDAFAARLSDDMLNVSGAGVVDKAQSVEGVKLLDLSDYSVSDARVVKVDEDAAVLTYTSRVKGSHAGRPLPDGPSFDSTLFIRREGRWLAAFHQETAAAGPAGPAPAGDAGASANMNRAAPPASPAASPALPPASATDAEKQVWDALKRKDWDSFANFLRDDALEVEPTGVTDKAGSVAAVKNVDFANVTLSDFREQRLDADATVVTYKVKGPAPAWPPQGMYHSTVWHNRGGRWQAVFHQGTGADK